MCGITGILRLDGRQIDKAIVASMTRAMAHRGPDDEGYLFVDTRSGVHTAAGGRDTPAAVLNSGYAYAPTMMADNLADGAYNLALGNRRLAVLDLSPAGHQPMCNEDGTIWIVHNGEIYNFVELRAELAALGHRFPSEGDTEVILHAYEQWGHECLNRLNGMWAFCIWDSRKGRLFCARDRFGVKPFYYYFEDGVFAFASEIKPLLALGVPRKPNDALAYDFLRWGLPEHTQETFFEGIHKLAPSHYLSLDLNGNLRVERYWELNVSSEIEGGPDDRACSDAFLESFTDAVRLRLRSDVPVGSCLSGGLDSSSVVCVASRLRDSNGDSSPSNSQMTFSSCFDDHRFDEREYIEEVVRKARAERHYVFPTPEGFLRELGELLWHQEEPFAGTSVFAQWLLMKEARSSGVTVMLDG